MTEQIMIQEAPWPEELFVAVDELRYQLGWRIFLQEEDRGQGCKGLTLSIVPNNPDAYHPEQHARTRFIYPVPAAAFNRESWEEWLWARIEETEAHERAEWFRFESTGPVELGVVVRRPFKPVHADGWDPGFIRKAVMIEEANTPNAGRLVEFPCRACGHNHRGKMGEKFTIVEDRGCVESDCACGKTVGARQVLSDRIRGES